MKQILLSLIFITLLCNGLSAQLQNGTKLNADITGVDVITGETVSVQAWLDEGKVVILDVFATWCPPCWTFHTEGVLEDLYEAYGPDGTDEIRILAIEADARTDVDRLFMQVDDPAGGANSSIGNWTVNATTGEDIHYNLIDNSAAATTLSIGYYPTLYVVQPDKSLIEVGSFSPDPRYQDNFWLSAIGVETNSYAAYSIDLGLDFFCYETEIAEQTVEITNIGLNEITTATLQLEVNGSIVGEYPYTGDPIASYGTGEIVVPEFPITENVEATFSLSEVNGEPSVNEVSYSDSAVKADLQTKTFKVFFTTDFYPSETSWELLDDNFNSLISQSYVGVPSGGGQDALQTFEYDVTIEEGVSCLFFSISDSYGDGLVAWDPSQHQIPGLQIVDNNGNFVKQNMIIYDQTGAITGFVGEGAQRFAISRTQINAENSVGLNDLSLEESLEVYPNPATDNINIDLSVNQATDVRLSVLDVLGKVVMTEKLANDFSGTNTFQLNVADLNSGIYNLYFQLGDKEVVKRINVIR